MLSLIGVGSCAFHGTLTRTGQVPPSERACRRLGATACLGVQMMDELPM
jgi:hypothetical protein